MKIAISGSMAYDSVLVFEDDFKNHILADQLHQLNVSFYTPQMRKYEGGCAGNIAYTLKLLGGEPAILATVGEDFLPYAQRLTSLDIDQSGIQTIKETFTAQAFIVNDKSSNQITAFHPGAMQFADQGSVTTMSDAVFGIVSPNGRDAMVKHATEMAELNIPFFFDPGQALPLFSADDLKDFLQKANYVIFNDYESHLVMEKTGLSLSELAKMVEVMIVTKGAQGSEVHYNNQVIPVASAPIDNAIDPTGCGDAYRAGVLYGMTRQYDWRVCAQIGALCGAIKIEQAGTQKHTFNTQSFAQRYKESFNEDLPQN